MTGLLSESPTLVGTMPGRSVAMVGAGQLARMTHQAAISLGIRLKVLASSPNDPAVTAGADFQIGDPADLGTLERFVQDTNVVTFDHERVPATVLSQLQKRGVRIAPSPQAMACAHDKIRTREVLGDARFPFAPFTVARSMTDVTAFARAHRWPLIAKAPAGGYDGKGVWTLRDEPAAEQLLERVAGPVLLEPRLSLQRELAVLVARSADGSTAVYPVVETIQRDAVCHELLAPAPVARTVVDRVQKLALRIAETLEVVGIMALEVFVTDDRVLVNELALRPHNSGHYSIEGAVTSQFEQHLRAVLGWPLGRTELAAPAVATVNIFGTAEPGAPDERLPLAASVAGAHVHWYAKQSRPGRKLGHVTVCADDLETARRKACRAALLLERGE